MVGLLLFILVCVFIIYILLSLVAVLIYILPTCVEGFFSLHPYQHLLFFLFLIVAILIRVR